MFLPVCVHPSFGHTRVEFPREVIVGSSFEERETRAYKTMPLKETALVWEYDRTHLLSVENVRWVLVLGRLSTK